MLSQLESGANGSDASLVHSSPSHHRYVEQKILLHENHLCHVPLLPDDSTACRDKGCFLSRGQNQDMGKGEDDVSGFSACERCKTQDFHLQVYIPTHAST